MSDPAFSAHNVFEMAVRHGGPGFWVRRTTWDASIAQVVGIGPFTAPAPYFGNPPVLMDVYSLDGRLREPLAGLPVPGTYKTWRLVDAPGWVSTVVTRRLDDPMIIEALAKADRRRGRSVSVPEAERLFLKVRFEQKDAAKAIGAKWDPAARQWWLRPDDIEAQNKAREVGFL